MKSFSFKFLSLYVIAHLVHMTQLAKTYPEQQLYKTLLDPSKYDPRVPPQTLNEYGHPQTNISLQLEIYGVTQVDKDENTVTFLAIFRQVWYDPRLAWNESEYGGINSIRVESHQDPEQIWTPDTIVREDAGQGYFSDFKDAQVRINSDGCHTWGRLGSLKVVTNFNYQEYPYDKQTVNITVGSQAFPDQRIFYSASSTPLIIQNPDYWYIENIEWSIEESSVSKSYLNHSDSDTRTFIEFHVSIQRSGSTMLVAMIIPGCLVAALGSLYYLIPRGTGSRVSYLCTILLTEIMFLLMLAQYVPQCKLVPQVGYLFLWETISLALLSIAVLILDKIQMVRNLEHKLKFKAAKKKVQKTEIKKKLKEAVKRHTNELGVKYQETQMNDEDDSIMALLDKEKEVMKKQNKEKFEKNVDKCMDITDFCFWIISMICYIIVTVHNLRFIA